MGSNPRRGTTKIRTASEDPGAVFAYDKVCNQELAKDFIAGKRYLNNSNYPKRTAIIGFQARVLDGSHILVLHPQKLLDVDI